MLTRDEETLCSLAGCEKLVAECTAGRLIIHQTMYNQKIHLLQDIDLEAQASLGRRLPEQ